MDKFIQDIGRVLINLDAKKRSLTGTVDSRAALSNIFVIIF